ncbi:GTP-binding protein LepA [Angustibacter sp. McL0619]|uniref:GTP-binding protein LepA n=1 Tax=Angustibacter sp. McL0619 TaxID=3415676 RepID=UPI003CF5BB7D
MSNPKVSASRIREHVQRLGEKYPPIPLDSADFTVRDPRGVRERFADVLSYMARVEMEVERNVLELAVMLPGSPETDLVFANDVWGPQEEHHGALLDELSQQIGLAPTQADLDTISPKVRLLGALAHLRPMHEIIRLLYYFTGAATERSATIAYQALSQGLATMGEDAVKRTVIDAIKAQEPGHFAFYRMSATHLVQSGALAPWQLQLTRFLRSRTFGLVGAGTIEQQADYGALIVEMDLEQQIEHHVRDIARVEAHLLWANDQGMSVPGYALKAFRDAAHLYRERAARDTNLVTAA